MDIKSVNEDFQRFFDDIMANQGFMRDEPLGEILEMSYDVHRSMDSFKKELAEAVLKIDEDMKPLMETMQRYRQYSGALKAFMKKFEGDRERLANIGRDNAEGLLQHVDKRVDANTLRFIFPNAKVFVLFFSESLVKSSPNVWKCSNGFVRKMAVGKKVKNLKILIVDYDLHAEIKGDKMKVSFYENGKIINEDYLTENG